MEEINKEFVLNTLGLIKKATEYIEYYIKNKVHEHGEVIEKGVNGVIDYMYIILKELITNQSISYGVILKDAKEKGLEKEFRVAYKILKFTKFIDYDKENKFIIIGDKLKQLIKLYNEYEKDQKERNTQYDNQKENISQDETNYINYVNVSIVNEIYHWVLDEINRNEWVSIDIIKEIFKGHDKEITIAINRIISERKGELIDNKIYKRI